MMLLEYSTQKLIVIRDQRRVIFPQLLQEFGRAFDIAE
jgi:hypothetical protein